MKSQSPWMPALVIVGALVVVTLILVKPQTLPAPQPRAGQTIVVGGDEAELRVALARFLDLRKPSNSTEREVLWVGQLPPEMDIDLPVPPGARVVGSRVGVSPKSVWVILDSSQPQDELMVFYTDFFTQQGFLMQDPRYYMNMPIVPVDEAKVASFCRASDGMFGNLLIRPGEDVPTTVGISVAKLGSECPIPPSIGIEAADALVPSLHHPSTAWLNDTTGGSLMAGADQAASTEGINSNLSPGELAEFYRPQLEAAGWKFTTVSTSEYGAWSIWSLKDADGNPWKGALVIVASPASDQKVITIEVKRQ